MQTNLNQFFNSGAPVKAAVSYDDGKKTLFEKSARKDHQPHPFHRHSPGVTGRIIEISSLGSIDERIYRGREPFPVHLVPGTR